MKTFKEFSEQAYSIDEGLGSIAKRLAKPAMNWFNKGKNMRIPNEASAKFGTPLEYFKKNPNPATLFGDDALQRGMSNKSFKAGKKPSLIGRPDRAFGVDIPQSIKQRKFVGVPAEQGGPGSGPTPITRELIKRPIRTVRDALKKLSGN